MDQQTAEAWIDEAQIATAPRALKYANGDHWQGGAEWIGPLPMSDPTATALIQKAFISAGMVAEVIERHTNGVVGQEPQWFLGLRRPLADDEQPTTEEQSRIDEAEAALTTWWTDRNVIKTIRAALVELLCTGRGVVRLLVPAGLLVDGGIPSGDLAQQLQLIHLQAEPSSRAAVVVDESTLDRFGVFVVELRDKTVVVEHHYRDPDTGLVVVDVQRGDAFQQWAGPLPHILMYQMERLVLITEPLMAQQRLLNLILTMGGRNQVQAGFTERVITNAELPGEWVTDPTTSTGRRFVPERLSVGPGRTTTLIGVQGSDGSLANPNVIYRDPAPVGTFIEAELAARRGILQEARQLHALISGDAAASGESRIQALTDYLGSLSSTANEVDHLMAWLLETALALAAVFAGTPDRYSDLRAVATCQLTLTPLRAEDADLAIKLVKAELWSRQRGMQHVRVDDTDAESAAIAAERPTSPTPAAPNSDPITTGDQGSPNNQQDAQGGITNG